VPERYLPCSMAGVFTDQFRIDKAARMLKVIGENEINHAFIAYTDAIGHATAAGFKHHFPPVLLSVL
jgi:hypothetical protein